MKENKQEPSLAGGLALSDSEPPMALDKFIEQSGISLCSIWRYRRKGWLSTVNLCGRHYLLRSEIARFNARAMAGEFQKACNRPKPKRSQT
jgi:hypothetical protein